MREILFRGKRVDNGEWVYGHYHSYDISCAGKTKICCTYHVIRADNVYPETVGQYTGLTDKNGKKIFEGDILQGYQYPYLSEGHFNYYAEVIYFENCPAFGIYTFKNPNLNVVRGISAGNTDLMEDWESKNWEVIGNVYDNPELLEEENDRAGIEEQNC